MVTIKRQNNHDSYDYTELFADTENDLQQINKDTLSMGTFCYVIETGNIYALNSQKEWILQ